MRGGGRMEPSSPPIGGLWSVPGGGCGGRCSVVVAGPNLNLSSGTRPGRIFAAVHQTIPTIRRRSATGHARRPLQRTGVIFPVPADDQPRKVCS